MRSKIVPFSRRLAALQRTSRSSGMVAQALQQLLCSPSAHGCEVASRRPKAGMGGLRAARHGATPLSAVEDGRILDPDGYKQRVGKMWRSRAPSYDFQNDFHPPLCEQLVTLADLKPGKMRILDVASGTGSVALSAARALGPDGTVMAVDISEAMLTQAKEKAREAGINMECLVHDIETATFPEGSFDRILCSNGMAYLQQPQATLQKFHFWLSPGSKLCFNNPLVPMIPLTDIIRRLAAELFGLEVADAAAVLGTPEAIQSKCHAAGFQDVQVTASQELRLYSNMTPEQYAELVFSMMATFPANPLNELLTPKQQQQLKAAYMPQASAMAGSMQTHAGDIALHFTMQWAVAMA